MNTRDQYLATAVNLISHATDLTQDGDQRARLHRIVGEIEQVWRPTKQKWSIAQLFSKC